MANTYQILSDMYDINLGFDDSDLDDERLVMKQAYLVDLIVYYYPSRYSDMLFSELESLEYVKADHAKHLRKILSEKLIDYESLFPLSRTLPKEIFLNCMNFQSDLIEIADDCRNDLILDPDKVAKLVEELLEKQYNIESVDYHHMENLVQEVIKLI